MFTAKAATAGAARTGLFVANGSEIATPNFVVATRRGAVPHVTPDHAEPAPLAGVYAEELWDRRGLVDAACGRAALPLRAQALVGACRRPGSRKITNKPNTADSMGIDTAQGSSLAPLARLLDFMAELAPDVFVVPYDAPAQSRGARVGGNRLRKMHLRSLEWARQFAARRAQAAPACLLVAQIPPELHNAEYLREISSLCDGYCFTASESSGLRDAEPPLLDAEPPLRDAEPPLLDSQRLRLSDSVPTHWGAVVDEVAAGTDLVFVPVDTFSDRGLALGLTFAADTPEYIDLNAAEYTTDMTELGRTGHARAYIHHMLEAREMTAQVLLQQHNMAVVAQLFSDMRTAIERGTFAAAAARFAARYGPAPKGT